MSETTAFKSCSNAGDIISFIPAMRKHYTETGKKVILYLWLNRPMIYPDSNEHPVTHNGEQVGMNEAMFSFIRPLLLSQDFMEDVRIWQGEEIKVDFDRLKESFQIMPYGSLNRYIFYLFPDLSCDLSTRWIFVDDFSIFSVQRRVDNLTDEVLKIYNERGIKKAINGRYIFNTTSFNDKIIVNLTGRYRNHLTSYFFLKEYENDIVFAGTENEYDSFCSEYNLNVYYLRVGNFLELAKAIRSCEFFLGNQSMCFQIAEGLKVPRILERCPAIPNVIPIGENAYDFHYQLGLETHFKTLYELTK